MNYQDHCQGLFLSDREQVECEDATDEKTPGNSCEAGEDDEKAKKYDQEYVIGGAKHHFEGETCPEEMGDSNQFDGDGDRLSLDKLRLGAEDSVGSS